MSAAPPTGERCSDPAAPPLGGIAAEGWHPAGSAAAAGLERPTMGASRDLLRWLESLAVQPTRAAAMEHLATELQTVWGGGVVRVAWGNPSKVRRLFDSRLGWLGSESSLWKEISDRWDAVVIDDRRWIASDTHCLLRLPQPGGSGQALLWFSDSLDRVDPVGRLAAAAPAVAAVLWSRPRIRHPLRWCGQRQGLLLLAGVVLIIAVGFLPTPYRVACTARVEPVHQRIVAAPFEATLLECRVQPGDRVSAGDLLVVLDGRPLRLETEALQADLQQARKQHDAALATGRIADAQLADLERRQLQRRIDLLQQRLVGLEVRSPIDGVVVSGDLQRAIGSPVDTGQQLLEIAPLRQMTMEVEIPERDIRYVPAGAMARVRLDAAAIHPIDGRLQVLFPAAELRDDRNVFVGQWQVDNADGALRPGMRGSAVVYGPRRPLAWPLVRNLVESVLRTVGW